MPADETVYLGRRFGHYEVLESVGAGGMGMVYKARHVGLETTVALKTMPPGFQDIPVLVERFRREAQVMARLQHPNIVRVTDFGEDAGAYYLVMEFVPGSTLAARLGRPLPAHEAIALLAPIAAALDAAHAAGVVHRDLKPSNVMIADDGAVKVTDFGLARILEGMVITQGGRLRTASDADSLGAERTADSPALSAAGQVLGTLEYMSPEQRAGEPVDARTDVYAMAVIAFEMLVGRRPRGIEYPHELRPDLSREVTRVLHRALGAPDRRPATAGAFVEEMRGALRPRRSALPVLATLAVLALAAVAAWNFWPQPPPPPPPVVVDEPDPPAPIEAAGAAEGAGRVDVVKLADGRFRLIAVAEAGHHFAGWRDVNAPANREVTVDRSTMYTARFEINRYTLNTRTEGSGRVTGPTSADHGRTFAVNAEAEDGWIFAGWEDGTSSSSRELTLTADREIVATFERRRVRVTAVAGPGGRVEPAGLEVAIGSEVKFTAIPDFGYAFHAWTNRSRDANLTIHVTEPTELTAEFRDGVREVGSHDGPVWDLDFSPDGRFLVSGGEDRRASVWDLANEREHATYTHQYLGVNAVAVSHDGKWVASGGGEHTADIWKLDNAEYVHRVFTGKALTAVAWTADGKHLLTGSALKVVGIWDIENRKIVNNRAPAIRLTDHDFEVNAVALSPDGKRLATGFGDAGVRIFPVNWDEGPIWDTALAPLAPAGKPAFGPSTSVAWTSDGALLVARAGKRVAVWDTSAWEKPLRYLDGPGGAVTAVAAGARIAAAYDDGAVRVWEADGSEIGTLASRGAALYALDFSPDGAWLATAGEDGIVKLVPLH